MNKQLGVLQADPDAATPDWRDRHSNPLAEQALPAQVYGGGVAVAMLACVPDWPYFNKHPQSWLPSQKQAEAAAAKSLKAR